MPITTFTPPRDQPVQICDKVFLVEFCCKIENNKATGSLKIRREEKVSPNLIWEATFDREVGWVARPITHPPIKRSGKPVFVDDLELNTGIKGYVQSTLIGISPDGKMSPSH